MAAENEFELPNKEIRINGYENKRGDFLRADKDTAIGSLQGKRDAQEDTIDINSSIGGAANGFQHLSLAEKRNVFLNLFLTGQAAYQVEYEKRAKEASAIYYKGGTTALVIIAYIKANKAYFNVANAGDSSAYGVIRNKITGSVKLIRLNSVLHNFRTPSEVERYQASSEDRPPIHGIQPRAKKDRLRYKQPDGQPYSNSPYRHSATERDDYLIKFVSGPPRLDTKISFKDLPILAVSKGLGDFDYFDDEDAVPDIEFICVELEEDEEAFCLVGCDGVFESSTRPPPPREQDEQWLCDLISRWDGRSVEELLNTIFNEAHSVRGSKDNFSGVLHRKSLTPALITLFDGHSGDWVAKLMGELVKAKIRENIAAVPKAEIPKKIEEEEEYELRAPIVTVTSQKHRPPKEIFPTEPSFFSPPPALLPRKKGLKTYLRESFEKFPLEAYPSLFLKYLKRTLTPESTDKKLVNADLIAALSTLTRDGKTKIVSDFYNAHESKLAAVSASPPTPF